MQPIYTDITAESRDSVKGDLEHRKMLIQAGEELKTSPAMQYVLRYLYHSQAENLLSLKVTQGDKDNGFAFMLAHNNVQARLDTLNSIWILGEHSEKYIEEYRLVTENNQTNEQEM